MLMGAEGWFALPEAMINMKGRNAFGGAEARLGITSPFPYGRRCVSAAKAAWAQG